MKTNKLIASVGFSLFIAGCSTPGDVRDKGASFETTSAKPSKVVAGCVADKMEKAFKDGVHSRPTTNGYSVWKEDAVGFYGKTTGLVVDVADTQGGSNIMIYSSGALSSATETVVRSVNQCKQ